MTPEAQAERKAVAVIALAAAALAGCAAPAPIEQCIHGTVVVVNPKGGAPTQIVGRDGKPIPCQRGEYHNQAKGG